MEGLETLRKRRKCWLPAFSPFPTMFSEVFLIRGHIIKQCGSEIRLHILCNLTLESWSLLSTNDPYVTLYTLRVNPFPNKPWFLRVCSTRLMKALWEKDKPIGPLYDTVSQTS